MNILQTLASAWNSAVSSIAGSLETRIKGIKLSREFTIPVAAFLLGCLAIVIAVRGPDLDILRGWWEELPTDLKLVVSALLGVLFVVLVEVSRQLADAVRSLYSGQFSFPGSASFEERFRRPFLDLRKEYDSERRELLDAEALLGQAAAILEGLDPGPIVPTHKLQRYPELSVDLSAYQLITGDHWRWGEPREAPKGEVVQSPAELVGRYVVEPVPAGQPVPKSILRAPPDPRYLDPERREVLALNVSRSETGPDLDDGAVVTLTFVPGDDDNTPKAGGSKKTPKPFPDLLVLDRPFSHQLVLSVPKADVSELLKWDSTCEDRTFVRSASAAQPTTPLPLAVPVARETLRPGQLIQRRHIHWRTSQEVAAQGTAFRRVILTEAEAVSFEVGDEVSVFLHAAGEEFCIPSAFSVGDPLRAVELVMPEDKLDKVVRLWRQGADAQVTRVPSEGQLVVELGGQGASKRLTEYPPKVVKDSPVTVVVYASTAGEQVECTGIVKGLGRHGEQLSWIHVAVPRDNQQDASRAQCLWEDDAAATATISRIQPYELSPVVPEQQVRQVDATKVHGGAWVSLEFERKDVHLESDAMVLGVGRTRCQVLKRLVAAMPPDKHFEATELLKEGPPVTITVTPQWVHLPDESVPGTWRVLTVAPGELVFSEEMLIGKVYLPDVLKGDPESLDPCQQEDQPFKKADLEKGPDPAWLTYVDAAGETRYRLAYRLSHDQVKWVGPDTRTPGIEMDYQVENGDRVTVGSAGTRQTIEHWCYVYRRDGESEQARYYIAVEDPESFHNRVKDLEYVHLSPLCELPVLGKEITSNQLVHASNVLKKRYRANAEVIADACLDEKQVTDHYVASDSPIPADEPIPRNALKPAIPSGWEMLTLPPQDLSDRAKVVASEAALEGVILKGMLLPAAGRARLGIPNLTLEQVEEKPSIRIPVAFEDTVRGLLRRGEQLEFLAVDTLTRSPASDGTSGRSRDLDLRLSAQPDNDTDSVCEDRPDMPQDGLVDFPDEDPTFERQDQDSDLYGDFFDEYDYEVTGEQDDIWGFPDDRELVDAWQDLRLDTRVLTVIAPGLLDVGQRVEVSVQLAELRGNAESCLGVVQSVQRVNKKLTRIVIFGDDANAAHELRELWTSGGSASITITEKGGHLQLVPLSDPVESNLSARVTVEDRNLEKGNCVLVSFSEPASDHVRLHPTQFQVYAVMTSSPRRGLDGRPVEVRLSLPKAQAETCSSLWQSGYCVTIKRIDDRGRSLELKPRGPLSPENVSIEPRQDLPYGVNVSLLFELAGAQSIALAEAFVLDVQPTHSGVLTSVRFAVRLPGTEKSSSVLDEVRNLWASPQTKARIIVLAQHGDKPKDAELGTWSQLTLEPASGQKDITSRLIVESLRGDLASVRLEGPKHKKGRIVWHKAFVSSVERDLNGDCQPTKLRVAVPRREKSLAKAMWNAGGTIHLKVTHSDPQLAAKLKTLATAVTQAQDLDTLNEALSGRRDPDQAELKLKANTVKGAADSLSSLYRYMGQRPWQGDNPPQTRFLTWARGERVKLARQLIDAVKDWNLAVHRLRENRQRGAEATMPESAADTRPTRLGNVLAAAYEYPRTAYGIDTASALPRLLQGLGDSDAAVTRVVEAKATMDMLLMLSFWSAVWTALGTAAVFFGSGPWWMLPVVAFGGPLLSRAAKDAAANQAIAFGNALKSLFDSKRRTIFGTIGMTLPKDDLTPAEERKYWQYIDSLFAYGKTDDPDFPALKPGAGAKGE